MANRTLQNVRGAIDQDLNRFARRFSTASNAQSGLVKNIVDAIYGAVHRISVTNVTFDDYHVALFLCALQITPVAADKIIQPTTFSCSSVEELVGSGASYKSCPACDKYLCPVYRIHSILSCRYPAGSTSYQLTGLVLALWSGAQQ